MHDPPPHGVNYGQEKMMGWGEGGGGVAGFSGCPVFLCEIFFIVYYTNRTTFCITYFANMTLKSQFLAARTVGNKKCC